MNLCLLIAIALSALTGAVEAPVARPAVAAARNLREARSGRRVAGVVTATLQRRPQARARRASPGLSLLRLILPLTGAAAPRAPAHIG